MKRLIGGFRERESFKPAFTLVEMLIVVVIIGILGAAILPRFSGYLERTRDLKRQADLRNIAAAIQAYKNTHGEMPTRTMTKKEQQVDERGRRFHHQIAGYASALKDVLGAYINEIPKDPQSNNIVKIYYIMHAYKNGAGPYAHNLTEVRFGEDLKGGTLYKPGEYLYNILATSPLEERESSIVDSAAVLIAKVETPERANYIISSPREKRANGGTWMTPSRYLKNGKQFVAPGLETNEIKLCGSVEKATAEHPLTTVIQDGATCYYDSPDQLYYIVKIE